MVKIDDVDTSPLVANIDTIDALDMSQVQRKQPRQPPTSFGKYSGIRKHQ